MEGVTIRPARPEDAPAIAAIYNEGIASGQATFETRPRGAQEVEAWVAEEGPLLVAADGAAVLGWARVTPYSDRCVYQGVGEYGVYVAASARGGGVGRALLAALCADAEARGLHKLVGRMFAVNAASRALARTAGFREIGVERRHGRIDGQWRDTVPVERLLGAAVREGGA
jgi:L-amino acid N-acyltransferase YncA